MTKSLRYTEAFSMFGKEITLPDLLIKTLKMFVCHMYGWKEMLMLGTVCSAIVVEKSPVVHYTLVMMLWNYTSQGQTTRFIFGGKVVAAQQEQVHKLIMIGCTMTKKIVDRWVDEVQTCSWQVKDVNLLFYFQIANSSSRFIRTPLEGCFCS